MQDFVLIDYPGSETFSSRIYQKTRTIQVLHQQVLYGDLWKWVEKMILCVVFY